MTPYYQDHAITIYHADVFETIRAAGAVDAIITDPPYSSGGSLRSDRMQSTGTKYVQHGTKAYRPEFAGDNRDQRGFLQWVGMWSGKAREITRAGGSILVFTDWRQLPTLSDAIQISGWIWNGVGVWDKTVGRPIADRFRARVEFVVMGRNGPGGNPTEDSVYLDAICSSAPPHGDARVHATEKPAGAMQWLVPIAPPGGVILDPFMGSGSLLLAAKRMGRKAVGGDVDEYWCELAAKRVEQRGLFDSVS